MFILINKSKRNVTDVTRLPLTFLTTDHGQASLSPPLPGVFVVSDPSLFLVFLHDHILFIFIFILIPALLLLLLPYNPKRRLSAPID
jgi:hypothetical protein